MRISTHEMFLRTMDNFALQQSYINRVQEQIASGKKILAPSDDPIGIMQSLNFHYQFTNDEQFIKNSNQAQSQLEFEESILQNVNSIYHRFKELTIAVGSGSLSTQDRESIISEMEERLAELVSLANAKSANGNYLFSGFNLSTMPVQQNLNGQYLYYGDSGQTNVMLGEATSIISSDQAKDIFFAIENAEINTVVRSGTATRVNTNLGLVNAGTLPALVLNDLTINSISIDRSSADGLSTTDAKASGVAIANAINAKYAEHNVWADAQSNSVNLGIFTAGVVSGNHFILNGQVINDLMGTEATIQAAINSKSTLTGVTATQPGGAGTAIILTAGDGRNIQLQTDGTSLANFANFNMTAGMLNQVQRSSVILTSHQNIQVNGITPTNAGFNYGTTAPIMNTGTGVVSNAQVISQDAELNTAYTILFGAGGTSFSIYNDSDLSAPIEDFLNVPYIDGETIRFLGVELIISGAPNGGDSFGIKLESSTSQSIFDTFQNMINKIRSAAFDPAQLSYEIGVALSNIDNAEANLLNIRAQIGARLNIIDSQKAYHENLKIITQKSLSQVEDVDYSRVITQLSEYSFTLQAAQQSFVKVQSLNLFYFIR